MRRRKKRRLQNFCKGIITVCLLFILVCIGYAVSYHLRPAEPADKELILKVNQIAEYYEAQDDGKLEQQSNVVSLAMNEPAEEMEMWEKSAEDKADVQLSVSPEENHDSDETMPEWERERKGLMDNIPLNPRYPGNQDLADVLDRLMPQIVGDYEDTYDKVKACYMYLVENCSYSKTVKYDYEYDAYLLLTEQRGSCTYYAAAFHYMMLYIGLEDEIISGYRNLESGASFHRWNEINVDGVPYIFDTQWEDTLARSSGLRYVRFFKTYEELQGLYSK